MVEKGKQDQQPDKEVELASQDKFVVSRFLKRFALQLSMQQCVQAAAEALRSKIPLHVVKCTFCTAHLLQDLIKLRLPGECKCLACRTMFETKYVVANPLAVFNPQLYRNKLVADCTRHSGIKVSLIGTNSLVSGELEDQEEVAEQHVGHHTTPVDALLASVVFEPGFLVCVAAEQCIAPEFKKCRKLDDSQSSDEFEHRTVE